MTDINPNSNNSSNNNPPPNSATLCKNSCGFYGSSNFEGLCSKCFKEIADKKLEEQKIASAVAASPAQTPNLNPISHPSIQPNLISIEEDNNAMQISPSTPIKSTVESNIISPSTPSTTTGLSLTSNLSLSVSVPTVTAAPPSSEKKERKRCIICHKKNQISFFTCACNCGLLCASHRYPHSHSCTFDHKAVHAAKLTKANPLVVAAKFERI